MGIVHQHFALAANLSVHENLMLGSESLLSFTTKSIAKKNDFTKTAEQFGLEIDLEARVGSLSVGLQQRVEILKALVRGAKLLILDEPTSVLTPQEADSLFATLAKLVAQGMAVIFISHKLDEVMRISNRVAVLRHGKLVAESATSQTSAAELAAQMVGHTVAAPERKPCAAPLDAPIRCELKRVSAKVSEREQLRGIDLALRSGRLLGIAGVSGNGQLALAQLLHSQIDASGGEVVWQVPKNSIARVPEDRKGQGAVGDLPLWENAISERLRHGFSRWGWIARQRARKHATELLGQFDVRGGDLDTRSAQLSGGNLQKLILGRALSGIGAPDEAVIVAHQPTWGLDVNAVSAIHERLLAARDQGAAVLLISDDLDEILMLADDIAVMHQGKLSAAKPTQAWSRAEIGLVMAA